MNALIEWLGSNEGLAGWAQFFGSMLALFLTIVIARGPEKRRKSQLKKAAERLLQHGYEAIESYSRTSEYFTPFPLSIRQAALTSEALANDISDFPTYELDDQGQLSLARRLTAMANALRSHALSLEAIAKQVEELGCGPGELESLKTINSQILTNVTALIEGKLLDRPKPENYVQ
ncbi:hypothetical protein [uncultured Erythrobacter sp.]|uniref:hypothetical protein n=1 Tax=uncultured Erythrobacter sp. TaxID=263913 RepID=UPI002624486F|nr:hypothetical protein [uncultured Erythrobacter sp.]